MLAWSHSRRSNPKADTSGFDTVLNLFSEGADRSGGLTQWDLDYLSALYASRRDRARETQQSRELVSLIVDAAPAETPISEAPR